MKSNSDVAPVDLSNQLRVLTDDEMEKVAGGVTAIEYGLVATPEQSQRAVNLTGGAVMAAKTVAGGLAGSY
jgi:hypothetical protein